MIASSCSITVIGCVSIRVTKILWIVKAVAIPIGSNQGPSHFPPIRLSEHTEFWVVVSCVEVLEACAGVEAFARCPAGLFGVSQMIPRGDEAFGFLINTCGVCVPNFAKRAVEAVVGECAALNQTTAS